MWQQHTHLSLGTYFFINTLTHIPHSHESVRTDIHAPSWKYKTNKSLTQTNNLSHLTCQSGEMRKMSAAANSIKNIRNKHTWTLHRGPYIFLCNYIWVDFYAFVYVWALVLLLAACIRSTVPLEHAVRLNRVNFVPSIAVCSARMALYADMPSLAA